MNLLRTDYNYGPTRSHETTIQGNIIRKSSKKNKNEIDSFNENSIKDNRNIIFSPNTSFKQGESINNETTIENEDISENPDIIIQHLKKANRKSMKIGDLIEGKKNMEIAELVLSPAIDQNSIAKDNITLILRSNTGIKEEVKVREFSGKTVADLKAQYFKNEIKSIFLSQ